jgi:hypothetical protein
MSEAAASVPNASRTLLITIVTESRMQPPRYFAAHSLGQRMRTGTAGIAAASPLMLVENFTNSAPCRDIFTAHIPHGGGADRRRHVSEER